MCIICRVINIPTTYINKRVMTLKTYVDNFISFFLILLFLYLPVSYNRFMVCPPIDNLWITRGPLENRLFIGYFWGACQGLATA